MYSLDLLGGIINGDRLTGHRVAGRFMNVQMDRGREGRLVQLCLCACRVDCIHGLDGGEFRLPNCVSISSSSCIVEFLLPALRGMRNQNRHATGLLWATFVNFEDSLLIFFNVPRISKTFL